MKRKTLRNLIMTILLCIIVGAIIFIALNLYYSKNYAMSTPEGYVFLTKSQFSYIDKSDDRKKALKEIMEKYDLEFIPNTVE